MLEFQRGDRGSFEALFKKYTGPVVNFAFRFLGNRTRAEEAAQEIFIKVYLAREEYRPRAKFSSWLYRIATNVCLNEIRRGEYRNPVLSLEAELGGGERSIPVRDERTPLPENILEAKRLEGAFQNALARLPERQRAAFVLNRFNDASYRDIGQALGCSESSVRSLIHRATTTLKEDLKDFIQESS